MGGAWGSMYVCSEISAMWATAKMVLAAGSDATFTPAVVRIWWDLGSYFKLTHKSFSMREKQPPCLA